MRIGIMDSGVRGRAPATMDQMIALARVVETSGLSSLWLSNIVGHDAMTVAAVCGRATTRIELGTAVVPTYPRHPYAMAQQAASTQAAARGRFTLGVGPSHRVVVEERWGLSYDKAYEHTRDYLDVLVPLLRTGEIDHANARFRMRARLTATDGLPVSVILAALGPKMLALAGSVADGTATWMVGPRTLREHIAPGLRAAAHAAGRPAPRIVVGVPIALTDDVAKARDVAGKTYQVYGSLPSYRAMLDREGAAGPAEIAVVGDQASIGEQLRRFAEAGATDLIASPFGPSAEGSALERCVEALVAISRSTERSV